MIRIPFKHVGPRRPKTGALPPATRNYTLVYDEHDEAFVYVGVRDGQFERWSIRGAEFVRENTGAMSPHGIAGCYDPIRLSVLVAQSTSRGVVLYASEKSSMERLTTTDAPNLSGNFVLAYNKATRRPMLAASEGIWELSKRNNWLELAPNFSIDWHGEGAHSVWDPIRKRVFLACPAEDSSYRFFDWDGDELAARSPSEMLCELNKKPSLIVAAHPEHGVVLIDEEMKTFASQLPLSKSLLPRMSGAKAAYDPWLDRFIVGPGSQAGDGAREPRRLFYSRKLSEPKWVKWGFDENHDLHGLWRGNFASFFCLNGTHFVSNNQHTLRQEDGEWRKLKDEQDSLSSVVAFADHAVAIGYGGCEYIFDGSSWKKSDVRLPKWGESFSHGDLVRLGGSEDLLFHGVDRYPDRKSATYLRRSGKWLKVDEGVELDEPVRLMWDTRLQRVLKFGVDVQSFHASTSWTTHEPTNYGHLSIPSDNFPIHDPTTGVTLMVHPRVGRISHFDLERCSPVAKVEMPEAAQSRQFLQLLRFENGVLRGDDLYDRFGQYSWDLSGVFSEAAQLDQSALPTTPSKPSPIGAPYVASATTPKPTPKRSRAQRRQAPGKKLSAGTIRVDAIRALSKLRDYQLTDTELWICEVVRAAILKGATNIHATADADDVWVTWQNAFFDDEKMPELLDELVSPVGGRFARRLLAVGVNTALGGDAKFVEVMTKQKGSFARTLFTPAIYDGTRPEHIVADKVMIPGLLSGADGMIVHRKRSGLSGFKNWVGRKKILELSSLRETAGNHSAPIFVGGKDITQSKRSQDILRLPLRGGIDGFLAVTSYAGSPVAKIEVELAEASVTLQRASIPIGFDAVERAPLRLFLNAKRLPTNASRSEVRQTEEPVVSGYDIARQQLPDLIELLAQAFTDATDPERKSELRRACVQMLASYVRSATWRDLLKSLPELLKPLATLPLFKNAFGEAKALTEFTDSAVHRSDEALDPKFRNLFEGTLWIEPQDDQLFGTTRYQTLDDTTPGIRQKTVFESRVAAHEAMLDYLSHAPFSIPEPSRALATYRFGPTADHSCVQKSILENVLIEGCLQVLPLGARRSKQYYGRIVILHEGRVLTEQRQESPVPFFAWVSHAEATPNTKYDGLNDGDLWADLWLLARAAAVAALEFVALPYDPTQDATRPNPDLIAIDEVHAKSPYMVQLLQRSVELAAELIASQRSLGYQSDISNANPLYRASVWPCTQKTEASHPGFSQPTTHIAALRDAGGLVLGVEDVSAWVPPGMQAVEVDESSLSSLKGALGNTVLLPYTQHRNPVSASQLTRIGRGVLIEEPDRRGVIGWAKIPGLSTYHRGVPVRRRPFQPSLLAAEIHVDDDLVIPDGRGGVARSKKRSWLSWEQRLVACGLRTMVGIKDPDSFGEMTGDDKQATILAAAALGTEISALLSHEELKHFESAKLFSLVTRKLTSIEELRSYAGDSVPFLSRSTYESDAFFALLGKTEICTAIAKLAGKKCHDGSEELEQKREDRVRDARLKLHRSLPSYELPQPKTAHVFPECGTPEVPWKAQLILTQPVGHIAVDVLVEGIWWNQVTFESPLPICAVVDIPESFVDETFKSLKPTSRREILDGLLHAVPRLLRNLLANTPESLVTPGPAYTCLYKFMEDAKQSANYVEFIDAIQFAKIFRAISGEKVSIRDVSTAKTTRVASTPGKWLPALEGETEIQLTLRLEDLPSFRLLMRRLCAPRRMLDLSPSVLEMHTARKLQRGTVETPRVDGDVIYKRDLLNWVPKAIRTSFPGGEVALSVSSNLSTIDFYLDGERIASIEVKAAPAIKVAVESSDLLSRVNFVGGVPIFRKGGQRHIERRTQALVDHLLEELMTSSDIAIENNLRFAIRDAVVSQASSVRGDLFSHFKCFVTCEGSLVSAQDVINAQRSDNDLWYVSPETPPFTAPVDRSIVKLPRPTNVERGFLRRLFGLRLVDATDRVGDAFERQKNLEAPKNHVLDVTVSSVAIAARASLELPKRSDVQGEVAILLPGFEGARGLHPHIDNIPLQFVDDICPWPTTAVFNAPLTPDARFEKIVVNKLSKQVMRQIKTTSAELVDGFLAPPEDALASIRVKSSKGLIAGVLWVNEATLFSKDVQFFSGSIPADGIWMRGVAGKVYPLGLDAFSGAGFSKMMHSTHKKLVKQLAQRATSKTMDAVRAQCVVALVNNVLQPKDLPKSIKFPSLQSTGGVDGSPTKLLELIRSRTRIRLFDSADGHLQSHEQYLIMNESLEFRTLEKCLSNQLYKSVIPNLFAAPEKRGGSPQPKKSAKSTIDSLDTLQKALNELLPDSRLYKQIRSDASQRDLVRIKKVRGKKLLMLGGKNPELLKLKSAITEDPIKAEEAMMVLAMHLVHLSNIAKGEETAGFDLSFMLSMLKNVDGRR